MSDWGRGYDPTLKVTSAEQSKRNLAERQARWEKRKREAEAQGLEARLFDADDLAREARGEPADPPLRPLNVT